MRVLVVATRPTEPNRGDPAPMALLIHTLVERGHDVHLVCTGTEPLRSFGGLTVRPVHNARSHGVPAYAAAAFEAARAFQPQLVLAERAHLALGRAVATRTKAICVPIFADDSPRDRSPFRRALRTLDARLIRATQACLAFGPLQADEAMQHGAARVIEMPGVTGLQPINQPASGWLRKHLKLEGGVLAVAWGELGPEHGTDILIEGIKVAADADADVHAAIFGGDETSLDRYDAKAERLGIHDRVHLLGAWPASKLATLVPEADILVDASIIPDRTPSALYSFLASHRAVLLCESTGRERLIGDDACLLAPPDRLGIGHALTELARSADLRNRYAQAAAARVAADHTTEAFAEAIEPLERLAGHEPGRGVGSEPSPQAHSLGA